MQHRERSPLQLSLVALESCCQENILVWLIAFALLDFIQAGYSIISA